MPQELVRAVMKLLGLGLQAGERKKEQRTAKTGRPAAINESQKCKERNRGQVKDCKGTGSALKEEDMHRVMVGRVIWVKNVRPVPAGVPVECVKAAACDII